MGLGSENNVTGRCINYVIAEPSKRLIAHLIDSLLSMPAFLFIIGIIIAIVDVSLEIVYAPMLIIGMMWFVVVTSIQISYFWSKGISFGKRQMKLIAVNKTTGVKLSFGGMFLRETIGKYISGLIFSLGWIWILIDKDRQGWHDKLIGSVVVKNDNNYEQSSVIYYQNIPPIKEIHNLSLLLSLMGIYIIPLSIVGLILAVDASENLKKRWKYAKL
jgi:uncharacterized RDD family membrane protein YckC